MKIKQSVLQIGHSREKILMKFYLNVKRFDKIVKDLLMEKAELLFDTIFMDVNVVLVQLYSDYVRLHKVTTSLKKLVKESLLLKFCTDCKTFQKAILRFAPKKVSPLPFEKKILDLSLMYMNIKQNII